MTKYEKCICICKKKNQTYFYTLSKNGVEFFDHVYIQEIRTDYVGLDKTCRNNTAGHTNNSFNKKKHMFDIYKK